MSETHDYETDDMPVVFLDETMTIVGESGGLSAIYGPPLPHGTGDRAVTVSTEHGQLLFYRTAIVKILAEEGKL